MSEPTPDPLIHPMISKLAALVQSGKVTAEDLAKPFSVKWPGIPPELLPFVQSPNLSTLAEVLTSHPRFCWHPLVCCQKLRLLRLRHDVVEDLCHSRDSAPVCPQNRDLWLDTSVPPYVLKKYDAASVTWTTAMTFEGRDLPSALETIKVIYGPMPCEEYTEQWRPLELDAALDRMLLPGHKGDKEQDSKPAYLAYEVLGALLGALPEKIRNTLDNFRHKRRPKPTR